MLRRRLDRLFARFRRRGDARALGQVFDATAPELYRVATHLSKDLHTAEDLVQSTFLAAIEARESWDESQGLLPWLIGILARQAAYERRRRSRIVDPGRLAPREEPDPAAAVENLELSDELARAIDGIPSLYREVLLAHLRQGQTPQEIARDLGRAPGTVRVQLHRALEMVRKSLPAGLATSGMLGALAPRGLPMVRAAVVRSAMKVSVSAATAAVVPPMAAAIAGLVLCAAVATGLAIHHSDSSSADAGASSPPNRMESEFARAASTGSETSPIEELTAVPSGRLPVETPAVAGPSPSQPSPVDRTRVSGRLLMPDGTPAAGAYVALVRMSGGSPSGTDAEGKTKSDGTFGLDGAPGPGLVVGLYEPFLPIALPVALAAGSDLQLEPAAFSSGARIGGRVRILGIPAPADCEIRAQRGNDGHGFPLQGQDLVWSEGALRVRSRLSRTDEAGRFAIEGLEPGIHRVSLERTPEQRMLRAELDVAAPAEDVALDIEAARLHLRLQGDHQPIEAHVALHENGYGRSVWGFGGKSELDVLVPPGSFYVVDVDKEGYASAHLEVTMPASGGTIERDVELVRRADGAELAIELVTSDGTAIQDAGFGLFGTRTDPPGRYRPKRRSSHGRVPDVVRDVQSVDGLFRLQDLPPDRYRVEVVAEGRWDRESSFWYADPVDVELGPRGSEQRRVVLHLGGRLRIRCVNQKGETLPARCRLFDAQGSEVTVNFFAQDGKGSIWRGDGSLNASAPNGANETVPALPPGRCELRLSLAGYRDAWRQETVEAGKVRDVTIVLDDG